MNTNYFLLNALGPVDTTFFLVCLGIIVLIVAIYFLIPIFNKSQYEERRENLRKREAAFKKGRTDNQIGASVSAATEEATVDDGNVLTEAEQQTPVSEVEEVKEK